MAILRSIRADWWEQSFGNEFFAQSNSQGRVHGQDVDCHSSDGSSTDQDRAIPAKVAAPFVSARMKQRHDAAGCSEPLNAGHVGAFVTIAVQARQCQVRQRCRSAVLDRDHMLDFKRSRMRAV